MTSEEIDSIKAHWRDARHLAMAHFIAKGGTGWNVIKKPLAPLDLLSEEAFAYNHEIEHLTYLFETMGPPENLWQVVCSGHVVECGRLDPWTGLPA